MRHSDLKLTMGAYLDTKVLPVAAAVQGLPPLMPEEVSHDTVSESQGASQSDTETQLVEKEKPLINQGFRPVESSSDTVGHGKENGSCGWVRTNDLVVNSHPLYR